MAACPAALPGIGLDEIGQGDPQLDVHSAERGQLFARPRQAVQVHVAGLDLRAILAERQQSVLHHQGGVVGGAEQGAVETRNAPAIAAKHRQLLGLRAGGVEPLTHSRRPFRRLDDQAAHRLGPERRLCGHHARGEIGAQSRRAAGVAEGLVQPHIRAVVGGQKLEIVDRGGGIDPVVGKVAAFKHDVRPDRPLPIPDR